jgi:hypothetical protein
MTLDVIIVRLTLMIAVTCAYLITTCVLMYKVNKLIIINTITLLLFKNSIEDAVAVVGDCYN